MWLAVDFLHYIYTKSGFEQQNNISGPLQIWWHKVVGYILTQALTLISIHMVETIFGHFEMQANLSLSSSLNGYMYGWV